MSKAPRELRDYTKLVLHLLRYRNILFAIYENYCKLQEGGFGSHINFLQVIERQKNIAELVSYENSSNKRIATEFDHTISRFLRQTLLSKDGVDDGLAIHSLLDINEIYSTYLQCLGLFNWEMEEQTYQLRCTV